MRFPLLRLCVALVLALISTHGASAQLANSPKPHRIGELTFLLPASWQVRPTNGAALSGVIFAADDGAGSRLTIARLPSSATSVELLPETVDAMSAPETANQRIALEESGLTPLSGTYHSAKEDGVSVETMGFRCKAPDAREYVVLITTWRGRGEGWRARLQYSEAAATASGGLLNAIRSSVRYRDSGTIGFGNFRLAEQPIPPEWTKAIATIPGQQPAIPASITAAPAQMPEISNAAPIDVSAEQARILQDHRGSLVFIESNAGAGSGFVCQTGDGVFLLTNQHVLASMSAPRFTRLDRTPITVGNGAAAVGHDIMRFALQAEAKPLPAMIDVEAEARIGDDVVVLGNGEGAGVIHPLPGKLIGIGPDKVEVSSEFVPGNSGSPIIHVRTGKVIGIATYLIQRRYSDLTSANQAKVRRFGYRIDSVKNWQPLNWAIFQQDKATMDSVETTSREILKLIEEIQTPKDPSPVSYTNSAISRAVRDTNAVLERKGISVADRKRAMLGFFSSVRTATQSDLAQARQKLRYDYFIRALADESQGREELYKLFDRIVKAR